MDKLQALVLSCSATKSIECTFPRPSYRNKPSLAIDPFSQRGSVPTFTSSVKVALLLVLTMNNQIREVLILSQVRFYLVIGTPHPAGPPFLDMSTRADRVSTMARSPTIGSYHLSVLL